MVVVAIIIDVSLIVVLLLLSFQSSLSQSSTASVCVFGIIVDGQRPCWAFFCHRDLCLMTSFAIAIPPFSIADVMNLLQGTFIDSSLQVMDLSCEVLLSLAR